MAYPFNRGSKAAPNWYGCYRDAAGKLRMKQAPREHASDKRTVQKWIDGVQAEIDAGKPDPTAKLLCGPLMETWIASLDNRAHRIDEAQAKKYLLPRFADMPIKSITKGEVIRWLDEFAKTKKTTRTRKGKTIKSTELLSPASQKKLFTLLSRFLSWASARDHIEGNPCRLVPTGERPQDAGGARRPWLADEEKVRALVYALGPQYRLMFATARAGGLRLNEVCGLRVTDTDTLAAEAVLVVRYSYDKPILKQDKGRASAQADACADTRRHAGGVPAGPGAAQARSGRQGRRSAVRPPRAQGGRDPYSVVAAVASCSQCGGRRGWARHVRTARGTRSCRRRWPTGRATRRCRRPSAMRASTRPRVTTIAMSNAPSLACQPPTWARRFPTRRCCGSWLPPNSDSQAQRGCVCQPVGSPIARWR